MFYSPSLFGSIIALNDNFTRGYSPISRNTVIVKIVFLLVNISNDVGVMNYDSQVFPTPKFKVRT